MCSLACSLLYIHPHNQLIYTVRLKIPFRTKWIQRGSNVYKLTLIIDYQKINNGFYNGLKPSLIMLLSKSSII